MGHYDSCYEADDRRKDRQEKEEPNYLLTIAALKKENAELQAKLDKATGTLNDISIIGESNDEPDSARRARTTLEEIM